MKKIVGDMFNQNCRTSSLKLSVPYEKDATIETDSKQRMMSLQDRMEPDENGSRRKKKTTTI